MRDGDSLLYSGVRAQLATDSAPLATTMLRSVLAEYRSLRHLHRLLTATRGSFLPSTVAALNGARCYLRCRDVGDAGGVLLCAHQPNEVSAGSWFRAQLDTYGTSRLRWASVRFDLAEPQASLRAIRRGGAGQVRRWAAIARTIDASHDTFRAIRVAELLAYYERFGRMLDRGGYRVVVTSTYSNPWGIAMNIAARRRGIPVIHVMHGVAIAPVPRLQYDVVVFNDSGSEAVFARAGCRVGQVILKGADVSDWRMRAPVGQITVGLLLSKQPSPLAVRQWIMQLLARDDVGAVVVRPHPATVWRGLAHLVGALNAPRVCVSNASASDDFARCDLCVAGNSSVHLDALGAGVPSVFSPELDEYSTAELPCMREGLVVQSNGALLPERASITAFYADESWTRQFLAFTNRDRSASDAGRELCAVVERLVAAR